MSLDQNDRVVEVLDAKPDSRRIKIKSIASDRNLADMASEITQKCKYIHPSRVEEVEQLLIKLNKNLKQKESEVASKQGSGGGSDSPQEGREKEKEKKRDKSSKKKSKTRSDEDKYPPADMESLDEYLELLYQVTGKSDDEKQNEEALKAQIQGTAMILKLCRNVGHLECLIQNNTVMGALTRVLQEEFKKSFELTFNILR